MSVNMFQLESLLALFWIYTLRRTTLSHAAVRTIVAATEAISGGPGSDTYAMLSLPLTRQISSLMVCGGGQNRQGRLWAAHDQFEFRIAWTCVKCRAAPLRASSPPCQH